jgi:hypothetical protein
LHQFSFIPSSNRTHPVTLPSPCTEGTFSPWSHDKHLWSASHQSVTLAAKSQGSCPLQGSMVRPAGPVSLRLSLWTWSWTGEDHRPRSSFYSAERGSPTPQSTTECVAYTTEICFLSVPEAKSLRSRRWQGEFLLRFLSFTCR